MAQRKHYRSRDGEQDHEMVGVTAIPSYLIGNP